MPSVLRFLVGRLAAIRVIAVVVGAADLQQALAKGVQGAVPSLFSPSRNARHSRAGVSLSCCNRKITTVHRAEIRSCQRAKVVEHF